MNAKSLVLTVAAAHALCGQALVSRSFVPDFLHLYERVSRSAFVITGKVVARKPIFDPSFQTTDPRGDVFTVSVEGDLCRQSDFAASATRTAALGGSVYLFVPFRQWNRTSDLDPRYAVPPEQLYAGTEYFLFLLPYPDQAGLISTYGLDPTLTYYRAFDGDSGAREVPAAERRGIQGDAVGPVMSAVTALCQAVKPQDPLVKIGQLQTLRNSADPAWRDSVDAAIRTLERSRQRQSQPVR
jgi:hypothetical protein